MKNQKYITVQGLNQSITNKIPIKDRLRLFKAHREWAIRKILSENWECIQYCSLNTIMEIIKQNL